MATYEKSFLRIPGPRRPISSVKDYKRQREKKVIHPTHPITCGKSKTFVISTKDKNAIHDWVFSDNPRMGGVCLERYQRFDMVGPSHFDIHILAEDIVYRDPVPVLFAEPRIPDEVLTKVMRLQK